MEHDALGAHARNELGISDATAARPVQAALASAITFAVGAAMPLLTAYFSPQKLIVIIVSITSLIFLALLGGISAAAGGARDFLGRAGDGPDCRRGRPIWCGYITIAGAVAFAA